MHTFWKVCTPLKRPFPLGLKAKGVQGAGLSLPTNCVAGVLEIVESFQILFRNPYPIDIKPASVTLSIATFNNETELGTNPFALSHREGSASMLTKRKEIPIGMPPKTCCATLVLRNTSIALLTDDTPRACSASWRRHRYACHMSAGRATGLQAGRTSCTCRHGNSHGGYAGSLLPAQYCAER